MDENEVVVPPAPSAERREAPRDKSGPGVVTEECDFELLEPNERITLGLNELRETWRRFQRRRATEPGAKR